MDSNVVVEVSGAMAGVSEVEEVEVEVEIFTTELLKTPVITFRIPHP